MPNTGGTNGKVTASSSNGTTSIVTVHYPDAPDPPGRDETYDPADEWFAKKCDSTNSERPYIDVTCDETGKPTSAKAHK